MNVKGAKNKGTEGDVLIFRAFFVFTGPITHAQFKLRRTCALKHRKPKKWHPVFDYPRARGISIPLTVNARGLWGRDCSCCVSSKFLAHAREYFARPTIGITKIRDFSQSTIYGQINLRL